MISQSVQDMRGVNPHEGPRGWAGGVRNLPTALVVYTCGAHRAWLLMGLPLNHYDLVWTTCALKVQCRAQC